MSQPPLVPLTGAKLPAAFAARSFGMTAAARTGVQASFGIVGYKGRAWSIKYRGDSNIIKDNRGAPVPTLDVVIVGVAPAVSKIFYAKSYTEGDDSAPDCFSVDGERPDASAPRRQNDLCATCQHNQWGSRITEAGKRAKACQDSRRIAVVPLGDIENKSFGGPMLLRIPPTSLLNLANYGEFLDRNGADFPRVATQLGFDYDVAYPRLTFTALGFIEDEEQAQQIIEHVDGPVVARILEAAPVAPAAAAEPPPPAPPPQPEKIVPLQRPAPSPPQAPANPVMSAFNAAPETVEAEAAPAPRGRRRAAAAQVDAAPADLETAIDNLLDGPSAA